MSPSPDHIAFVEASTTGAGEAAHRVARSLGLRVTFFTRDRSLYPGSLLEPVHQVIEVETNDPRRLTEAARALHRRRPLGGLTTTADLHVPQTAWAADALGLATMPPEAAGRARNKGRMRDGLAAACPHLNPPYARVAELEEARELAAREGYPFIAKPEDANDSDGVQLVRSDRELADYFEAASGWSLNAMGQPRSRKVLLEGFLDGPELSVETLQEKGGPLQILGVTGKVTLGLEAGRFVEDGAYFPHRGPETPLAERAVTEALEALGLDCGVVHTELRLVQGEDGNPRPKILEINPRLIGNAMGNRVIPLATGADPVEGLIQVALGRPHRFTPTRDRGAAMRGLCAPRPGTFRGFENLDEIAALEGIEHLEVTRQPGDPVGPPRTNGDVVVWIFAQADTGPEALERATEAGRRLRMGVD